jgi:hypothetical protein
MQQIDYLTELLGFQGFYVRDMEVERKEADKKAIEKAKLKGIWGI